MPEFISTIRTEEAQRLNGMISGVKARATRQSEYAKTVNSISVFPKTKRVSTAVTEFHVY